MALERVFPHLQSDETKKPGRRRKRVAEGDPIAKSVNRQLKKRKKKRGSVVSFEQGTWDLMQQADKRGANFNSIPRDYRYGDDEDEY